MKGSKLKTALLVGLFSMLFAVSAQAQRVEAVFEIPFAFQVQEKAFPEGKYNVLRYSAQPNLLYFESDEGAGTAVVFTYSDRGDDRVQGVAKLVFNRYGEHKYFLSEFWRPYRNELLRVPPSESEKAMVETWWKVQKVALYARPEKPAERGSP